MNYYFTVVCGVSHKPTVIMKWYGNFESSELAKEWAMAFCIMAMKEHKTAGVLVESEDESFLHTCNWKGRWDGYFNDIRKQNRTMNN